MKKKVKPVIKRAAAKSSPSSTVVRKRPSAAAASNSPEAETDLDPSEDEEVFTGTFCEVMLFIDSRAVGLEYFRSHVSGIQPGHLVEFMLYSDKLVPTASACGTVLEALVHDDGAELSITQALGSFPYVQDYLDSMTIRVDGASGICLHLCSDSIHHCPGLTDVGMIHSDSWRIRYPEDLHEDWLLEAVPVRLYKHIRNLNEDVGSVFDTPGRNEMLETPHPQVVQPKGSKKADQLPSPSMLEVPPASRQKTLVAKPSSSLAQPASFTMGQVAELKKQLQKVRAREVGRVSPVSQPAKRRIPPPPVRGQPTLKARFSPPRRGRSTLGAARQRFAGEASSSTMPRAPVHNSSTNVDEVIRKRAATLATPVADSHGRIHHHEPSPPADSHGHHHRPERKDRSRRKRRRDRSSRSSSSSDSNDLDFRDGRRYGAGQENAIQRMAMTKPGKLLKSGLRQMYRLTNPSSVVSAADIPEIPATAVNYLHTIVEQTQRQQLSTRDARELKTLASAVDLLARGQLSSVGDLLMQRFKSIETSVRDQHWDVARQQELIPEEEHGASSLREHELAAKMALRRKSMSALGNK